jgi:hypothetical protein
MKIDNISQQEKNLYLFYKHLFFNNSFNKASTLIYNKWGLPIKGSSAKECLLNFEKKLGKKAIEELIIDLKKLARDFNLGNQWLDFLGYYFLHGDDFLIKKMPIPHNSFWISNEKDNQKNKTIKLEIGPYTTYREMKSFWPKIEKMQKYVWPDVKKEKISSKSIDKMCFSLNIMREKYSIGKTIEFADHRNNYFELNDRKITDAELINRLINTDEKFDISLKEEKRLINKIRQNRKREKMTK